MKPSLEELECLSPPEDFPDDGDVVISCRDLRAFVELIPCAKEYATIFGTHVLAEQEEQHGQG